MARSNQLDPLSRALPALLVLVLCAVVVVGLAVLPARTWHAQRSAMLDAQAQKEALEFRNVQLARQLEILQTDAEIQRLARQDFDLVLPGQESFRILPAPIEE